VPNRHDIAAQIWPHLAKEREPSRERQRPISPLAAAMYPAHVPKPKPYYDDRASLLKALREINARGRR